jgi:hypothetical protein
MNHDQFWQIVQAACRSDPRMSDEWGRRLTASLTRIPAYEIIEWNHIFDKLVAAAHRPRVGGANALDAAVVGRIWTAI